MKTKSNTVIHAEIDTTNCYGELCLNGIPIFTNTVLLSRCMQSLQVNPFVVPNLNVLELAVDIDTRGPSVSRQVKEKRAPEGATAIARLVRYPLDRKVFASPEYGEVLAEVKWSAAEDPFATSPRELRGFADVGEGYGRRVWQDAPQLTLDAATQNEALQLLQSIRSAMVRGDSTTLINMFEWRLRDVATAYEGALDRNDAQQLFIKWIAMFGAEPERVLAIELDKLDFRLAAERRLLLPQTTAFESALRVAIDHKQEGRVIGRAVVPYDLKFARIDGYLRIVA